MSDKDTPTEVIDKRKVMTPERVERLANARKKAMEVRKANAQRKKDMKLAEDLNTRKAHEDAKQKIKKSLCIDDDEPAPEPTPEPAHEPAPEPPKPSKTKSPHKEVEATDTASSSEEEQVIVKKPKQKKKKSKKKIVVVEESDTDSSDSSVEYVKKKKKASRQSSSRPPSSRVSSREQVYNHMYHSLFGVN